MCSLNRVPKSRQPAAPGDRALQSGQAISIGLLSDGDGGNAPVDFLVNYRPQQSFLIGSTDAVVHSIETAKEEKPRTIPVIDQALKTQAGIATPDWVGGLTKDARNPDDKAAGKPLVAALGDLREKGAEMLVAYSVLNTTNHWVEVLPPQIELNSPNLDGGKKKSKKKREILAEQVPITDYRLNARRLAPGDSADGAVQFARPGISSRATGTSCCSSSQLQALSIHRSWCRFHLWHQGDKCSSSNLKFSDYSTLKR